ncbi:hypothetical protein MUK42_13161 [Musa troglodytarum]|uniref:Uncharacterized protein n=1 Tax=Musa troglodytarum TaxID=320322 RepID=A0A9E7GQT6_9LILI|nr:hypothetical protein MUK42_13161 [Musa troglodytarum]
MQIAGLFRSARWTIDQISNGEGNDHGGDRSDQHRCRTNQIYCAGREGAIVAIGEGSGSCIEQGPRATIGSCFEQGPRAALGVRRRRHPRRKGDSGNRGTLPTTSTVVVERQQRLLWNRTGAIYGRPTVEGGREANLT